MGFCVMRVLALKDILAWSSHLTQWPTKLLLQKKMVEV